MSSFSARVVRSTLEPANPWFSWSYVRDNSDTILERLREHVTLTVLTILIALVIAVPLAILARQVRWLSGPILGLSGVLYTVPSFALFALMAPFTGYTKSRTVLIGLVIYALLVLVRNTLVGLEGVPVDVQEAARGMGYGAARMFWQVELPVALPAIMAGIRIATVSTIALVTVGVIIGHGGLGQLLFEGFNNNFFHAEIAVGAILCVGLALVADGLLYTVTRMLSPWARGQR
ncbi:MAG: ABC transporter permease [Actinomycetota bacterium]|nr:ABC transporter permease [Actinomycetota bacterium]